MHEILIAWSQNNRLALSYATTKLPLALPEVMMVRYRVRIENDGTYYRQVQELSKQYSSSMTLLSR